MGKDSPRTEKNPRGASPYESPQHSEEHVSPACDHSMEEIPQCPACWHQVPHPR